MVVVEEYCDHEFPGRCLQQLEFSWSLCNGDKEEEGEWGFLFKFGFQAPNPKIKFGELFYYFFFNKI